MKIHCSIMLFFLNSIHLIETFFLQILQSICQVVKSPVQKRELIFSGSGKFRLVKCVAFFSILFLFASSSNAQNVGIGVSDPAAKFHIKGSADSSQLFIDAHSTQSNSNPLIKLRNSNGTDLLWIHSDHTSNSFFGLSSGRINNAVGGGINNTFTGSSAGYSNTTRSWARHTLFEQVWYR